ncbi:adenosinetriphosphatase [Phakopsora pachyrhizi]|uniref:Adenosinetriphosphatase n=1 Tax=Phakopsora pachyrhizi TaxID=170000 RepID=A0AAV0BX18_PHAPC|nr:adenosinetriphosphatase [Phakopsora pachyrhizi]
MIDSTNLLNRQIMGAYRRHKISLNSNTISQTTVDVEELPSNLSTGSNPLNNLRIGNPAEDPDTKDSTTHVSVDQTLQQTPKRKLNNSENLLSAENRANNSLQSQCTSSITKKSRSNPSSSFFRGNANGQPSSSLIKAQATNVSLSDLGGIDSTVEKLLELIGLPILHPEIFEFTGLKPIRGLLLCGPPGSGKTMLASAISNQLGVRLIHVSSTSIVSGMSGESEKAIRDIFDQATKQAPCLLFIDEIDAITPKRETAQREMERRIVAQLLTCLDDLSLEKTEGKPVIVIGATNRPDSLDPALRRGGRFDHEILMGVPGEKAREQILKVLCSKLKLVDSFDYKKLAKMTPGYVGADLSALTASAGVTAIKRIFEPEFIDCNNDPQDMVVDQSNIEIVRSADKEIPDEPHRHEIFENLSPHLLSLPIINFLSSNPNKLSDAQLNRIRISQTDFVNALKEFQPSCKREGFSTIPDTTWAQIGALRAVRDELSISIIQPIRYPELFEQMGICSSFGVLLWGPPGCGKTLVAKAVANESQANFISVKGPELLNKYVGESEKAVRQVFVRARASAPCIIFFDELDALVPRRDDSLSESSSRVVNTLLTELDGLEPRKQIYVIGATNRPDVMDPAMVRPGRLDKMIFIDLPDASERWDIFQTLSNKLKISSIDSINSLIVDDSQCGGYSGADVGALIREASLIGLRKHIEMGVKAEDKIVLEKHNFEEALKKVRPSVSIAQHKRYRALNSRFNGVPAGQGIKYKI